MVDIKCYCDASYDPKTHIAVIGWKIGDNNPVFHTITNTNNTRAEIICLIFLIKHLDLCNNYVIYTDCQSIIKRLASKQKLIDKNFKNRRGQLLSNADLYQRIFGMIADNIKILHIAGHIPACQMNDDNIKFSALDKMVRTKLRTLTKK